MNNKQALTLLVLCFCLPACSYLPSWMGGKKDEKPRLPGERVAALPVVDKLQPEAAGMPVELPPVNANEDWAQAGGGVTAATSNLALKGALDKASEATAGKGEDFENALPVRPVVGGGSVFAMDGEGYISAHDAADIGKVRWVAKAMRDRDNPEIIGGGLAYDQGRLYAVSGRGLAMAFDATNGKAIWRKSLRVAFRSAPRLMDGKLFAVTLDNQIFALSAATGDVLWNERGISETAGLMNNVTPANAGDTVIAAYSSGEIYALATADGREIWSDSLAARRAGSSALFAGIGGDPVVDSEVVFAAGMGDTLSVYSLATGARIWQKPIGSANAPYVSGKFLYVLTSDNTLLCLFKFDGKIVWATRLASYEDEKERRRPITWRGPVLASGQVLVAGSRGQMALVDAATGKINAMRAIPDGVETPPVVAGGRVYLVTRDASLVEVQ